MKSAESALIAGREENVVIRAGDCVLTLLPAFGGKISSIQVRGQELLQQPLAPIAPRTRTMAFDEGDASGWDECLPSVAGCSVSYSSSEAQIPDHGDLWRVEWTRDKGTEGQRDNGTNSVSLNAKCFSLPLRLERGVALRETASGWRIDLDYKLINAGSFATPWSWAAHPLFAVEPGDRILLPDSIRSLRVEGSGGNRLGKNGDSVAWPIAKLAGAVGTGHSTVLSHVQASDSGIGDKLFASPLSSDENWCAIERPSAGVRIRVSFETEKTPYLGLWLCYGGWPERSGPKQNCVALEPSTAPVDSLAETGSWTRVLAPGESYEWAIGVDIKPF